MLALISTSLSGVWKRTSLVQSHYQSLISLSSSTPLSISSFNVKCLEALALALSYLSHDGTLLFLEHSLALFTTIFTSLSSVWKRTSLVQPHYQYLVSLSSVWKYNLSPMSHPLSSSGISVTDELLTRLPSCSLHIPGSIHPSS